MLISPLLLPGLFILIVSCAHLALATALLTTSAASGSIVIATLLLAGRAVGGGPTLDAIVLLGAGLCAAFALGALHLPWWLRFLMLLPQLTLLLISGLGGIYAALSGHYADGVLRPPLFILFDQFPRMIAPVLYVAAVFDQIAEP